MRKSGLFKKILLTAGFFTLFIAGYLAMNVATSCRANAYICICSGAPCSSNAGDTLIDMVTQVIVAKDIVKSSEEILTDVSNPDEGFTLTSTGVGLHLVGRVKAVGLVYRDFFDSLWYNGMLPAFKQMTTQLVVRDTDMTTSISKFYDATDALRQMAELRNMELRDHRSFRPSENSCVAASTVGGMARTAQFRKSYAAAAPAEKLERSGNKAGHPSASGAAADIRNRWDKYTASYCNPADNAGHAGCDAEGGDMNRDIEIIDEIFMRDTIDVKADPTLQPIIDDMLANLTEPFVRDPFPPDMLLTAQGREQFLDNESLKAKRQAIYDTMYYVVARRLPGSVGEGGETFINEIREQAGADPGLLSPNPSHNEIMQVMMSERFRTGDYSATQVDEPETNEREAAIQSAFQVMQMSDMLDLLERHSLLLAAQAGDIVGRDNVPDQQMETIRTR